MGSQEREKGLAASAERCLQRSAEIDGWRRGQIWRGEERRADSTGGGHPRDRRAGRAWLGRGTEIEQSRRTSDPDSFGHTPKILRVTERERDDRGRFCGLLR